MDPFLVCAGLLFVYISIHSFIILRPMNSDSDDDSDWLAQVEMITPYDGKRIERF